MSIFFSISSFLLLPGVIIRCKYGQDEMDWSYKAHGRNGVAKRVETSEEKRRKGQKAGEKVKTNSETLKN